ncbi:Protein PIN-LIKES 1 [Porphyridium purpureum]|uniref:Protein PIN-LIKES 1 n=1 Tax=Porphyridium purpureum TaxID=35688 RepID=A0A5J4YJ85_PORPP|nr:Protein PIN-LIKES 1 [Porphyridium purpureum]|eukprot:POR8893..scf291_13
MLSAGWISGPAPTSSPVLSARRRSRVRVVVRCSADAAAARPPRRRVMRVKLLQQARADIVDAAKQNVSSATEREAQRVASVQVPAFTDLMLVRGDVLQISVIATAKLLVTILIGGFAQKRGVLSKQVLSALSASVYNIFLPSVLFCNMVQTLAKHSLSSVGLVPLLALAQIAFGWLCSILACRLFRIDTHSDAGKFVTVSCAFGNSAALPLLFANNLFAADPVRQAGLVSGISFFLLGWSPLFWSIGYMIMAGEASTKSAGATQLAAPSLNADARTGIRARIQQLVRHPMVARVFAPPIVGALSGLLVGSIPVLRRAFLADGAPLGILFESLSGLGAAYVPCAVLVLAGSLASNVGKKKQDGDVSAGISAEDLKQIAAVSFVRFCLVPLFAVGSLIATRRVLGATLRPILQFTILLESVMPAAQNTVLMLQLENKPEAASRVATLLLYIYILAVIPISLGISHFLMMTGA